MSNIYLFYRRIYINANIVQITIIYQICLKLHKIYESLRNMQMRFVDFALKLPYSQNQY